MGPAYVDSLPNELLETIFKIGSSLPLEVDKAYPHRPLFSKLPLYPSFPVAISQVCVRWRHIVNYSPIFWTHIHLSRSLESHRRLRSDIGRSLDWVTTHLIRSANLPLHITLDTTRLPAAETIGLLSAFSTRWKSFTLLVSHVGSLPSILPSLVSVRVPRLQTLAIASDIYREGIICYEELIPFFVTSTPQLSTIHLNGVYMAWNELPLANLLNLELYLTSRWPNFSKLSEMFDASPMLQRLAIRDDLASLLRHVEQPSSKPTIELATLKHLEIHVYRIRGEYADVAGLMGLFSMPALETLTIKEIRPEEWTAITKVYDLPSDPRRFSLRSSSTIVPSGRWSGQRVYRRLTNSFPFLSSLNIIFTDFARIPMAKRKLGIF